jgi:hypothetical protein
MIVLDEHLLGPKLHERIAHWYGGKVIGITALRPDTIILDDAIPALLREQRRPTFITFRDCRAEDISLRLRRLFQLDAFRTQAERMGKIVKVHETEVQHYNVASHKIVKMPP